MPILISYILYREIDAILEMTETLFILKRISGSCKQALAGLFLRLVKMKTFGERVYLEFAMPCGTSRTTDNYC